ncbi:MAG: phosphoglucosamine mutase [bacterium]|nr:phosphoglucosamine mutase [bacterium]MBU1917061.1 phosphoglucosamine mutase [bacterium]
MKKLFGTDGVRGEANQYPMTPEVALSLGQAIACYFQKQKTAKRIVIGKDTRRSSYMIEQSIAAGVCSMGRDAVLLGPISTPGVAFLTRAMRADAGIMISASHNPFNDNGIKFFDHDGYKLSDKVELEIERMIEKGFQDETRPTGGDIGKAYRVDDSTGRYVEFVKRTFPKNARLDDIKVIIDCANGAAYKQAPMALWELGADLVCWGIKPNGININLDCGALHPEKMCKMVLKHGANIGIALDGDADRAIICDENGKIIDGDQIIALCALELASQGFLTDNNVVGTIMTNLGVESYLKSKGVNLIRTQVGDRYIIEKMRKENISFGGEPSGHIIFHYHNTTGDGIIAALQVLAIMQRSQKPLSELIKEIPLYPQVSTKIHVQDKIPLEDLPAMQQALKELDCQLKGKGRAVVRYSGTEPVLRLMIEGEDEALINGELTKLITVAEATLQ